MKNARIPVIVVASLIAISIGGCAKQKSANELGVPGPVAATAPAESRELPRDVVFQQKIACSDAARSFAFVATSPRGHPYAIRRHCYSATLNSCIVEYAALDDSTTVFDALTGEVLVEYLNYPGSADGFNLASRIGTAAAPATATTTAEEGVTPQRAELLRWSTHLFEACAR